MTQSHLKNAVTAVIDIGKTHVKLVALDALGATVFELRRPNVIADLPPYPQHDTEGIWNWLLDGLSTLAARHTVEAIVPVTHGATAALIGEHGLVRPILDYEYALPQVAHDDYELIRPHFDETCSPSLPAGLNLGRQLFWQQRAFPGPFSKIKYILMYPQYWAWRLCGVVVSEVTSLGCHTDLWDPRNHRFSSLADNQGWSHLFPPIRQAGETLGTLLTELAQRTGLPTSCRIICGIHDSNASLLRYLGSTPQGSGSAEKPTVISTGTWVIAAALGQTPDLLDQLDETRDMLANVNAYGVPVASIRFMGGREFSALAGNNPQQCSREDLQHLIAQETFALPSFSNSGGPFAGRSGVIVGPAPVNAQQKHALATLYCALMTDTCLRLLHATGPVVIEGSFTANRFYAQLLAALYPTQPVCVSDDASGTVCGGWLLADDSRIAVRAPARVAPFNLNGWTDYASKWQELTQNGTNTL